MMNCRLLALTDTLNLFFPPLSLSRQASPVSLFLAVSLSQAFYLILWHE